MKSKLLLGMMLSLLTTGLLIAQVPADQDTIYIEGGLENAGLLESTINGDVNDAGERIHPNRVYKLEKDNFHIQYAPIDVVDSLGTVTIVGEKGGKKPVIILMPKEDAAPSANGIIAGSLTIKNLYVQCMVTNGQRNWNAWQIRTDNQTLTVEDCVFEFSQGNIFHMNDVTQGLDIFIRNTYFRDLDSIGQWWNARVFTAKVPTDSVVLENVTVSNSGLTFLQQETLINYLYMNHCTLINSKKYPIMDKYYKKAYITNNLFVNCNWVGEDYNVIQSGGQDPDRLPMGIVGIDTVQVEHTLGTTVPEDIDEISEYQVYVANNVHWVSPLFNPYYNGQYNDVGDYPISRLGWELPDSTVQVRNVPPIWMNSRTETLFNEYGNIVQENNWINGTDTEVDPQLNTPGVENEDVAEDMAIWNRGQYGVADEEISEISWWIGDADPNTVPGIEVEDAPAGEGGIRMISDLVEDFTYNADLTSAIDNRRIGALHWWEGEMDTWDSEAAMQMVENAYQNAVKVENDIVSRPSRFTLSNAYPNPFNPTTTIEFTLANKSHINLTIYNQLGQKVTTLVDEPRVAGSYKIEWDASDMPSGLYFYTMKAGNVKKIRKVVLIK